MTETSVAPESYDERIAALRGDNFVPSGDFKNIKMVEVPLRRLPHRGEMLIGYVFEARPEEFVDLDEKGTVSISPTMPVAGPIFYSVRAPWFSTKNQHFAHCAGCNTASPAHADRSGDRAILRWAREHRCEKRSEFTWVQR